MSNAWATVIASIVGVGGSVIVAFLNKLRKENRQDHAVVAQRLDYLHDDMKTIEKKLDNHINWHLDK